MRTFFGKITHIYSYPGYRLFFFFFLKALVPNILKGRHIRESAWKGLHSNWKFFIPFWAMIQLALKPKIDTIASFRTRILVPIATKRRKWSWNPFYAPCRHCSNHRASNMNDFKRNISHASYPFTDILRLQFWILATCSLFNSMPNIKTPPVTPPLKRFPAEVAW